MDWPTDEDTSPMTLKESVLVDEYDVIMNSISDVIDIKIIVAWLWCIQCVICMRSCSFFYISKAFCWFLLLFLALFAFLYIFALTLWIFCRKTNILSLKIVAWVWILFAKKCNFVVYVKIKFFPLYEGVKSFRKVENKRVHTTCDLRRTDIDVIWSLFNSRIQWMSKWSDWSRVKPSLSVFKTQVNEAFDEVVLLMSETFWTSVDTRAIS